MADSLKLRVVAEGVETMDQLLKLTRQGCHEVQGYLVSPPVPAAQFRDIMPLPPLQGRLQYQYAEPPGRSAPRAPLSLSGWRCTGVAPQGTVLAGSFVSKGAPHFRQR